jgi:hypothetical protein
MFLVFETNAKPQKHLVFAQQFWSVVRSSDWQKTLKGQLQEVWSWQKGMRTRKVVLHSRFAEFFLEAQTGRETDKSFCIGLEL